MSRLHRMIAHAMDSSSKSAAIFLPAGPPRSLPLGLRSFFTP
ncbi:hypothetical protein PC128_g20557 [Phytophthora cactorum]|nr:hypothetical protein PC120_g17886 [Phytophthora cactorum]KAG3162596.1 hypothetical protein PC128_g20557 [Phytophthora cactorum]KAG4046318.1 hypothetical protein PC123_g18302 [Phytophthora cactorum]